MEIPTEDGWYWFRGKVFRKGQNVLYPVLIRGNLKLMNGSFMYDFEPLDGEFRRAEIPFPPDEIRNVHTKQICPKTSHPGRG